MNNIHWFAKNNQMYENEKKFNWRNKIVLIVEDVEINYRFLEEALYDTEATIIWAKNGAQAIEFFKNQPIDLVLMDIKMPDLNGYEVTERLKAIRKVPVIAQTAYAMPEDRERFENSQCDEYITKPINHLLLLDIINKYLSKI